MTIDELLKLQAEWIEKATDVAMQVGRNRRGMSPREIGIEKFGDPVGIDEQIRKLEARGEAMLKAFDAAIEKARCSGGGPAPQQPGSKPDTPKKKQRDK